MSLRTTIVQRQLPFTPSVYASGVKTRGGVKTKVLPRILTPSDPYRGDQQLHCW